MKKSIASILKKLEKIEENQLGQLQGGFGSMGTGTGPDSQGIFNRNCKTSCSNNCAGANCAKNCGIPS